MGVFRLTRAASAEQSALGKQIWACGSMNCAIHAAAAQQRLVRSVHDRVDVKGGDVGLYRSKCGHDSLSLVCPRPLGPL
jgi:hypothetical protein